MHLRRIDAFKEAHNRIEMNEFSRITVISGPERGKVFELAEELVHIGRAPENQITINDPELSGHQASIVRRNGRYAIYTPIEQAVEVDGAAIPAGRWVWLPEGVTIQFSRRTSCQITCRADGAMKTVGDSSEVDVIESNELPDGAPMPEVFPSRIEAVPPPKASPKKEKRFGKPKRAKKKSREVARFITDKPGDPLVQLGEDGHMPELTLAEGLARKSIEGSNKKTNPLVLYAVLSLSLVSSLALLFVDIDPIRSSVHQRERARRHIARFYGIQEKQIEPYQQLLRDAQLAESRNNDLAARRAYRRVLDLLNSEDINRFTGLTGRRANDEELKNLIAILLRD